MITISFAACSTNESNTESKTDVAKVEAKEKNWMVAYMKKDFKKVFAFQ